MPNRYYDWRYYTPDQIEKEKSAKWLSLYKASSKHITEMGKLLEIHQSHRGLLTDEAYKFLHEGIQAMKDYVKIEDMKKLESEIKGIIDELQQRTDKRN